MDFITGQGGGALTKSKVEILHISSLITVLLSISIFYVANSTCF